MTHMHLNRSKSLSLGSDKHSNHRELSLRLALNSWNSNKANVMYTRIFSTYVILRVASRPIRRMNKRWLRCSCRVSQTVQSGPKSSDWNLIHWRGNSSRETRIIQREKSSREFEFLSSPKTTGKWRPRTDETLLRWEWKLSRYQL